MVSGPERRAAAATRRAGAPGQHGLRLVAGQMVHLADQRDRAAERRRRDQPDGLGDCGMVAELQHRAADIARENDREQRADPREARDRLPVGRDEDQDRRPEQQCRHDGQDRSEAQRPAVMRLDIEDDRFRGLAVDQAGRHPSGRIVRGPVTNSSPSSLPRTGRLSSFGSQVIDATIF